MNILLDSHALLWALHAPGKILSSAVTAIADPRNTVYFSAASAWELEIKSAMGKLNLPGNWLEVAEATGFLHVPVTAAIARASAQLAMHHRDPFDRLIIAQAIEMGLRIATRDGEFSAYGVPLLEV